MVTILVEGQELVDSELIDGAIVGGYLTGDVEYYLFYGRTLNSVRNNAIKYLNKMWYRYEYQIYDNKIDIMDYLHDIHWKHVRPAASEPDEDWKELFDENDFTFPPRANSAGVIIINRNMFDKICEYLN